MYFEELELGQKFYTKPITLTLEDIKEFANKYDPLPLHIDEDAANNSMFKGTIASGFHTFSAVWGQWVRANITTNEVIVGIGLDYLNWLLPVYPGDTLTGEYEISELKPSSKGGKGLVVSKITIYNQKDEAVITSQVKQLLKTQN